MLKQSWYEIAHLNGDGDPPPWKGLDNVPEKINSLGECREWCRALRTLFPHVEVAPRSVQVTSRILTG